ncbi:MAG: aminoacyl-tRNA hydrolase [Fimbriimonas sp.]
MIVGLGNPGPAYRGTRHNVGFDTIDFLAERHKIKVTSGKHQALIGTGEIDGTGVCLAKPLTFMNLSGQSVAPLLKTYSLGVDRLIVIADDLDLHVGRVRMKPKGSAGGHNGHKSLIALLGTQDYARIKIGIGSVGKEKTIDHVLGSFNPEEKSQIQEAVKRAAYGVEAVLARGVEAALSLVNEGQP